MSLWLRRLGADVFGLGLVPQTNPNLHSLLSIQYADEFFVDLREKVRTQRVLAAVSPDVVFHLAAQSLVREGYRDPIRTIETNVLGTANLLESIRTSGTSVRVIVVVTTDKVYESRSFDVPFTESDRLGGADPYSSSKAAAEILADSYYRSYLAQNGVSLATARSGNVIGGGDWARHRLIPDAIRAWQLGRTLLVRNPDSVRPWQHVLEPLCGYLLLAEKIWLEPVFSGAYNFGPNSSAAASVEFVISKASQAFDNAHFTVENQTKNCHEAVWLMLESSKAREVLGVSPRWSLGEAIERTMSWYKKLFNNCDAQQLCESDISDYLSGVN